MSRRHVGTYYFSTALSSTDESFTQRAKNMLEGVEFDTLLGAGLSGVIAVTRLASGLRKNALYARKPDDESTHSSSRIEGFYGNAFIFVDDVTSTGNTLTTTLRTLRDTFRSAWDNLELPKFVGVYLYEPVRFIAVEDVLEDLCDYDPNSELKELIEELS